MATTLYPKSYVLERIAARRASIESRRIEDTAIVARESVELIERQKTYLDEIKTKMRERLEQVIGLDLTDDAAQNYRVLSSISSIYLSNRAAPNFAATGTAARNRLDQAARELDALDHTEAYLRGTPVDEFSLTSLKRLGLIEAIKFSLDDAVAAAKKK